MTDDQKARALIVLSRQVLGVARQQNADLTKHLTDIAAAAAPLLESNPAHRACVDEQLARCRSVARTITDLEFAVDILEDPPDDTEERLLGIFGANG